MQAPRRFTHFAALVGILLISPQSIAADVWATPVKPDAALAGKPNCQFQVITAWLGSQIAWDGACKNGKAHGQGVLRAYKKDEKTQVFYGVLEAGQLRKGVIDSAEGGYVVGEFSNGILKPADDLKVGALTVETFTLASKIAKAYSERLKKAGNASSSEYYMQQSEKLANQMD